MHRRLEAADLDDEDPVRLERVDRLREELADDVEAVAAAYARGKGHAWWRSHLAEAFQLIVKREGLTRRHAVMKKIEKRWPQILV